MRDLKMLTLIWISLFALAGCFGTESREPDPKQTVEQVPVDNPMDSSAAGKATEVRFTLEHVEEALKGQGIDLRSKHLSPDWVLSGVQAMMYALDENQPEDSGIEERISVYIFETEEERIQGQADFHKQTEKYNMQVPNEHELANVLILYWHRESLDEAANAKFEQDIKTALSLLSVVNKQAILEKTAPLRRPS